MKRLTLHRLAASLHRFIASSLSTLQKFKLKSSYIECESEDDDIFRLCYGNIGNVTIYFILPM
jgi:hypothetical protein